MSLPPLALNRTSALALAWRLVHFLAGWSRSATRFHDAPSRSTSASNAASCAGVHGGSYLSRHCFAVRPPPIRAAIASHESGAAESSGGTGEEASPSPGEAAARAAPLAAAGSSSSSRPRSRRRASRASSSGVHARWSRPTSPRRHEARARARAGSSSAAGSSVAAASGKTTGQYQWRTSHGPPWGWLSGSSHAPSPRRASRARTSSGAVASARQCSPTPGGTTSMTRRALPLGHVDGSERATPVGVPLSGGIAGRESSRETWSWKLASAEPRSTPSRKTIPSRRNVSRSVSASIAADEPGPRRGGRTRPDARGAESRRRWEKTARSAASAVGTSGIDHDRRSTRASRSRCSREKI